MLRTIAVLALLLLSGPTLTGCASIVNGSSQNISVLTVPPGATIKIDNGTEFTTPSQIRLKRKNDYVMTISKPGFQTQVVPVNSVLSGWLAGNILFGGLIGGGIDFATGAAYTLTPEEISITLTPLGPGEVDTNPAPGSLTIEDKLKAVERLYEQGVLKENEYQASKKKLLDELTGAQPQPPAQQDTVGT